MEEAKRGMGVVRCDQCFDLQISLVPWWMYDLQPQSWVCDLQLCDSLGSPPTLQFALYNVQNSASLIGSYPLRKNARNKNTVRSGVTAYLSICCRLRRYHFNFMTAIWQMSASTEWFFDAHYCKLQKFYKDGWKNVTVACALIKWKKYLDSYICAPLCTRDDVKKG